MYDYYIVLADIVKLLHKYYIVHSLIDANMQTKICCPKMCIACVHTYIRGHA